ncbi:unnamed protein product [Allacma fusca]|uniref:Uncharacterized protein n=1 Tax=Allacma fusca TaxID=39272 RepID=A0A8J2PGU9_9HEXA|nr:unnamed protein product [Allacma fusca]
MHASIKRVDKNEWRAPADDTVQVVNPKSKDVKPSPLEIQSQLVKPFSFPIEFYISETGKAQGRGPLFANDFHPKPRPGTSEMRRAVPLILSEKRALTESERTMERGTVREFSSHFPHSSLSALSLHICLNPLEVPLSKVPPIQTVFTIFLKRARFLKIPPNLNLTLFSVGSFSAPHIFARLKASQCVGSGNQDFRPHSNFSRPIIPSAVAMAMYDAGSCKLTPRAGAAGPEGEMDALLLGTTWVSKFL